MREYVKKLEKGELTEFDCGRCKAKGKKSTKKSKNMYVWGHAGIEETVCNGCGGELISRGIPRIN